MGRVVVSAIIESLEDLYRVQRGELAAAQVRRVEVTDALVDTGATARAVRALLPRAHFATVYAKPAGREAVDTFITEVSQNTWILFPWDTEPQFIAPLVSREN